MCFYAQVSDKWNSKDPTVLDTLNALLRAVMMRHSRFQTYSDSLHLSIPRPLVPMPPVTMHWVGLSFPRQSSQAYLYHDMNLWALDQLQRVEQSMQRDGNFGNRSAAIMHGMLFKLRESANCPGLLDLVDIDMHHRQVTYSFWHLFLH